MRRLLTALVAAGALASCFPSPNYPELPPATMDTWLVGDSITVGYSAYYPQPVHVTAEGGAGFVTTHLVRTIGTQVLTTIAHWGAPRRIFLMGGSNDGAFGASLADTEAAYSQLVDTLRSLGVTVIPVTEPSWGARYPFVSSLNNWLTSIYGTADCAPIIANQRWMGTDGIHPSDEGYAALGNCVWSTR